MTIENVEINPQPLESPYWPWGYVLDIHTLSSFPMGTDASGYMQYDTIRSPVGEMLYQLTRTCGRHLLSGINKNPAVNMTVFIAGSISIKKLNKAVTQRLDSIIDKGYAVVVGDAGGVDKAVPAYLQERRYGQVTVYCINQARNNLGEWPVQTVAFTKQRPKRSDFAKKDLAMAQAADVGFMIWDGKGPGTLKNVLNLLSLGKQSLVYAHTTDEFLWISGSDELRSLVDRIPAEDRRTIDQKIGLSERVQDVSSRPSYGIQPVSHSVGESQLDLFGAIDYSKGDQR